MLIFFEIHGKYTRTSLLTDKYNFKHQIRFLYKKTFRLIPHMPCIEKLFVLSKIRRFFEISTTSDIALDFNLHIRNQHEISVRMRYYMSYFGEKLFQWKRSEGATLVTHRGRSFTNFEMDENINLRNCPERPPVLEFFESVQKWLHKPDRTFGKNHFG